MKSNDIEVFKNIKKEKNQMWIPIIDVIPIPQKTDNVSKYIHIIAHFIILEIEDLQSYSFSCLSFCSQELCQFSEMIFRERNLIDEFNIGSEKFNKIIQKIYSEYNVPAYHNFYHGFFVFQV